MSVPAGADSVQKGELVDYHRLDDCTHVRAFGYVQYNVGAGENQVTLSDWCFDPEAGSLSGAETIEGLAHVSSTKDGDVWEVIASGDTHYDRISITIAESQVLMNAQPDESDDSREFNLNAGYRADRNIEVFPKASSYHAPGYAFETLSAGSELAPEMTVYLWIVPFRMEGGASAMVDSQLSGVAVEGTMAVAEGNASGSLTDSEWNEGRNSAGGIRLAIDENGEVTGSAELSSESARLAGFGAREWKALTLTIPDIFGYAVGDKGQMIKAFGVARGSFETASGDTVDFDATVSLSAYDSAALEAE